MKKQSISTTATLPIPYFKVYFKIHYHTQPGRAIYIVGDCSILGNWVPTKGLRLQWNENDEWTICIKIDRSKYSKIEYKFIVNNYDYPTMNDILWEPGENRVITNHMIQNETKSEYFNCEYWGYRTIKLKLNYNLPEKQRMMVIGSIEQLGQWIHPVLMKQQTKIDILNGESVQQWSISFIVDSMNFSFRYFYVIRNDDTGSMIWERGNGRFLKSSDLRSFRQVQDQYAKSPIKIKTQLLTACQHLRHHNKKNGSFCSEKQQKSNKETSMGYSFSDKEPSFFYYESFGRLNKLDWNFVVQFSITQINENIIIGPYPQNEQDIINLSNYGIRAVLNLQTRLDVYHRGVDWDEILASYKKHNIYMKNFEIFDMDPQDFEKKITKAVQILKKLINQYEFVYIHCTSGIGRAPSLAVIYLASVLQIPLDQAIAFVKSKREHFYINLSMLKKALQKTMIYNNGLGYDQIPEINEFQIQSSGPMLIQQFDYNILC
ncbi:unnamed protein product (macronuclear) [Paramecium tetraurelia]|uniref:Protein-tyrosine-phosphatase n=1 Tax=Paramecium tetraurelia TaxID=5888 RepID=A0C7E8_PARTE|nr:uncharacterized protein GSPATT00035845001 [Paramecium tetraurelia]CAK66715.1 unnamed protein product [Paramecium tetraurelia]|eukprot:XP_001434112.1 hypothetical protein (macronuclear) [Paramecium tetraurelia strain d4-2]